MFVCGAHVGYAASSFGQPCVGTEVHAVDVKFDFLVLVLPWKCGCSFNAIGRYSRVFELYIRFRCQSGDCNSRRR